jgi:hypothetical protein
MSTRNSKDISKDGTDAGVRYRRGAREAIATVVKVAGISTSNIKAEELDSPLAGHAGVVVGVTVPRTAGATAAESIISSRKESDKSSRASTGAGNQRFGVGRMVAVGITSVEGEAR